MVDAIEKPGNIRRHINGGKLSPISHQDFHTYISVQKRGLNSGKKIFLYIYQQNEFIAVDLKTQYPPVFKSLQSEVYPENRVSKLNESFPLSEVCRQQVIKKLFESSYRHLNYTRLVIRP